MTTPALNNVSAVGPLGGRLNLNTGCSPALKSEPKMIQKSDVKIDRPHLFEVGK